MPVLHSFPWRWRGLENPLLPTAERVKPPPLSRFTRASWIRCSPRSPTFYTCLITSRARLITPGIPYHCLFYPSSSFDGPRSGQRSKGPVTLHGNRVELSWCQSQSQGTHSNCVIKFPVFPCFFPCPTTNFPCANLRDLWLLRIHKTDPAPPKNGNFRSKYPNILYL